MKAICLSSRLKCSSLSLSPWRSFWLVLSPAFFFPNGLPRGGGSGFFCPPPHCACVIVLASLRQSLLPLLSLPKRVATAVAARVSICQIFSSNYRAWPDIAKGVLAAREILKLRSCGTLVFLQETQEDPLRKPALQNLCLKNTHLWTTVFHF